MEPWGSKKVSFLGFGRRFFEDEDERQEVIMEYIEKDDEESYYYEEEVIDEDDEFYIDSPVRKYRSLASSEDPPQDDEKIRTYDEDYPDDEEPPRISPVPILRDSLGSNSGDEEPPEHKPAPLPTKPLDPLPSSEVKSKPSSKKFSSSRIMTAASTRYSSMKSSKMDPDTPAYDPPQTLVIQPFKPRFSPRYSSDGCFDDISDILSSKDDDTVNDASTLDTKSSKSLTSSKNKSAIVSVAKSETKRVKMKERQLVSRKLDRYTPIDSMSQIIERSSTFFDPERAVEPQLELEEDIDRKRKRTTRRGFYWFLIFVLTLAIIFATTYLVIYILRLLRSDDNMYVNLGGDDNISAIDSNFVGSKPTTGMDPYTPGSCDFGLNYTQPHVSQQCFCGGKIAVLARDVREKYYSLKMLFSDLKVSEVWEFPEESCDPRNQALVWLATTYTRDKVDLIQKYVLSSLYFTAKGEQWTNSDQWLEHLDVCFWSGVSCNDMGQVTGLSLDSNKLEGEVSTCIYVESSLQCGSTTRTSVLTSSHCVLTIFFADPRRTRAFGPLGSYFASKQRLNWNDSRSYNQYS